MQIFRPMIRLGELVLLSDLPEAEKALSDAVFGLTHQLPISLPIGPPIDL